MMTKTILRLLLAIIFLAPIISTTHPVYAQGSADFFKGYKMMRIPRATVPVGAMWQQGFGPNGVGSPPEALQVNPAPSVVTANEQFRLGAELSILQWLGLSGARAANTKINATQVELVTVKDIGTLKVQPGNQVLYEAVKVGGFSIQTDSSTQADVKVRLENQPLNVKVEDSNTLTVSGSNLYVAYRVITLGSPRVSRKKLRLRQERELSLGPYKLNFRTGGFLNCICNHAGREFASHEAVHDCEDRAAVLLVAESETRSSAIGEMMREEYRLRLHNDGTPPRPIVLFTTVGPGFMEVDRLTVRATVRLPQAGMKQPDGTTRCLFVDDNRFDQGSEAELVTTRYPFKTFDGPSAAGW